MSGKLSRPGRIATLMVVCAFVLTGCEFSVYKLPLPGGADLGDNPYSVRVKFRDVLDLVPQSAVKVNDVSVGRVDAIEVDGYAAEVSLLVNDSVELPDDAIAEIRQTSLLGEKFVSLEAPPGPSSGGQLEDGDLIPLDRSGRNPEVEEVLGAMSLLLNGGGVAQLKTITVELNKALEGRETDVKSVLQQLDIFTGELNKGKGDIIDAIESLNRLAISLNEEEDDIELALDELPAGLASIDSQRDDLVRMLDALSELSNVAVGVIQASKAGTIDSLQSLDPILTRLADAGDAFPKSLQVFLTYPFVDAVVGTNPTQARNLHMGDYTNLSVQIDLDLSGLPFELPADVCQLTAAELDTLRDDLEAGGFDNDEINQILDEIENLGVDACEALIDGLGSVPDDVCELLNDILELPTDLVCGGGGGGGGGLLGNVPGNLGGGNNPLNNGPGGGNNNGPGGGGGGVNLPGGLNRAAPGAAVDSPTGASSGEPSYDSELGAMLVWGMMPR